MADSGKQPVRTPRTREQVVDEILKRVLRMAIGSPPDPPADAQSLGGKGAASGIVYLEQLAAELLSENKAMLLNCDVLERALMDRLSMGPEDGGAAGGGAQGAGGESPLEYAVGSYGRAVEEGRKVANMKDPEKLKMVLQALECAKDLLISYAGLSLQHADMFPSPARPRSHGRSSPLTDFIAGEPPALLLAAVGGTGGVGVGVSVGEAPGSRLPVGFLAHLVQRFEGEELDAIMQPVFTRNLARQQSFLQAQRHREQEELQRLQARAPASAAQGGSPGGGAAAAGPVQSGAGAGAGASAASPVKDRAAGAGAGAGSSGSGSSGGGNGGGAERFGFICECFFMTARVLNLGLLRVFQDLTHIQQVHTAPEGDGEGGRDVGCGGVAPLDSQNELREGWQEGEEVYDGLWQGSRTFCGASQKTLLVGARSLLGCDTHRITFLFATMSVCAARGARDACNACDACAACGAWWQRMGRDDREALRVLEAMRGPGEPADLEERIAQHQARVDQVKEYTLCYESALQDPEVLQEAVRFYQMMVVWLVRFVGGFHLPLPAPAPKDWASMPEHFVDDAIETLLLASRIPHALDGLRLDEYMSFIVMFMGSPLYIKNPYLRAKMVKVLQHWMPSHSPTPTVAASMASLFEGHPLAMRHLAPNLIKLYVDVEFTGSHNAFYEKFNTRFEIADLLEYLWDVPCHRSAWIHVSARSASCCSLLPAQALPQPSYLCTPLPFSPHLSSPLPSVFPPLSSPPLPSAHQAFPEAASVIGMHGLLPGDVVQQFMELAAHAKAAAAEAMDIETQLDDIPNEFLDPIQCTLMRDPVTLPSVRRTAQIVQGGGGEGGKAPNWLGRHRGAQPVNQTGLPEVLEVRQEVWQEAGEERQEEGLRKPLVKHGKQQEVQAEVEAEEEVPRTMVQAARCFVRQPGVLLGIAATLSATCLRAMHPHWGIRDTAGMVMARTFLCLLSPSLPLTLSISLTLSPSTSPPLSSLLHLFPSPFLPFSPSTALPLSLAAAAVCWWLLQEWVLHAKLLHSSFPWWGRSIHAKHHRRPYHHVSVDKPDVVLPVVAGAAIVSRLILGASTLSLTALMAYYLMAITYEWTHFLVHTHVPMHSRISRAIKNAHIKHHLRDSRYWFSFTCPPLDIMLGCLLLCFLVVAYPFVVRSADVTIRSVTLERDFLGLNALGVEVYMECVKDNEKITLPGVETKGVAVNYTGQEAWQPVMKLNPGECKRCTVYQKKKILLGIPAPTAQWTTCYANFTTVDPNPPTGSMLQAVQPSTGFVTFNSPTQLIAVLACPDCNQPSPPEADSSSPPADSSAGSSTSNAADSSSTPSSPPTSTESGVPSNVTSWMADAPTTEEGNYDVTMYVAIGATLLSVGVVLFVGIVVFYFWRRAKVAQTEADMYRDQAEKSLERGASDGGDLPGSGETR
ncbi:unnamed protein product, partial [Closterium sp. NIES-54]